MEGREHFLPVTQRAGKGFSYAESCSHSFPLPSYPQFSHFLFLRMTLATLLHPYVFCVLRQIIA